jgi:hypothetical protein
MMTNTNSISPTCEVLYIVFEQEALRVPQHMRHGAVHGDVPGQEEEYQPEHVHSVCKHIREQPITSAIEGWRKL